MEKPIKERLIYTSYHMPNKRHTREDAILMWLTVIHGLPMTRDRQGQWQVDQTPTLHFKKDEWAQLMERRKKEKVYRKDKTTKRYRRIR
jgi:hypothetical protein